MKKIINKKMYSTESAECVGSDSYSSQRDFHHWTEELYKKSNGEFFLYGEGGPLSKYCKQVGLNSWSDGWNIIPMTENEARSWAEKHLDADDYIEIFGEPEE